MTTGKRAPEAQCKSSCIRARPWELVAVKVLTPAELAPMQAAIAECSLSTLINLAGN
jgi:hypothetical protein